MIQWKHKPVKWTLGYFWESFRGCFHPMWKSDHPFLIWIPWLCAFLKTIKKNQNCHSVVSGLLLSTHPSGSQTCLCPSVQASESLFKSHLRSTRNPDVILISNLCFWSLITGISFSCLNDAGNRFHFQLWVLWSVQQPEVTQGLSSFGLLEMVTLIMVTMMVMMALLTMMMATMVWPPRPLPAASRPLSGTDTRGQCPLSSSSSL